MRIVKMNRKEFFMSCSIGICSCFAFSALLPPESNAQEEEDNDVKKLQNQMEFVHKRFATLVSLLNDEMEPEKRMQMFEKLGRACSLEYKDNIMKFEKDIDGFLNEISGKWVESVNYDKENKTILLTGTKMDDCFCPLAKKSITPGEFCECSKGWQKGVFEVVTGKKVYASVVESVLRGGECCSFKIQMS